MKTHISQTKAVSFSLFVVSTTAALLLLAQKNIPRARDAAGARAIASPESAPRTTAQVREAYGQIPLSFEANRGQADETIDFVARGPGYAVALSPTEAIFVLRKADNAVRNEDDSRLRKISTSLSEPNPPSALRPPQSTVLRMILVGGNRDAEAEGLKELEGRINYFIGNDPAKWRTGVPTFGRVRYAEVYPGIDVVYYGNQRRLEYDFVVAPGRDPRAIALEFSGAKSLEVEAATGDLLLRVGEETIRQRAPVTYQEVAGGGRREVESRYALRDGGRVGFEVGEYDASAPLVIDPVLEYSTFLGGSNDDGGRAIAVDSAGNSYVTGRTNSTNFPTANAIQGTIFPSNGAIAGDVDVFVTKINAAGTALVYSTYLGGNSGDGGLGIALDSAGNAYVTGQTRSTNFPTANPIDSTYSSGNDVFVTKINAAGSALVYSTYLGGTGDDLGYSIAVDSAGNAYLTGETSGGFPTANPFDGTFNGGRNDAFVTKINAAGTALVYSTYLGGSIDDNPSTTGPNDVGSGIAVDSAGNAYITGNTWSTDFPTANPIQGTKGAVSPDAFVTKINAAGTALVYSTFLGGSSTDGGNGIALDSAGNAYVTGTTSSPNFPTANAFQSTKGSNTSDAFVTKINAAGTALVYSTYLGGDSVDTGNDIALDAAGNAYIAGDTASTNFPTANPSQGTRGGSFDVFVTKVNAAGSALVYSTYLGGSGRDAANGIALDSAGNAYVTGETPSGCLPFPTTTGAFDTTFNGGDDNGIGDAFISKISETAPPSELTPVPPPKLLNIATRMRVLTGDSALIGGFIITGNDPKRVIIRGIGPSTNIPGALENPTLELFDSSQTLLGSNDDWKTNQAEVEATTIPPTHELESAIVITLAPGAYSAVLRGQSNGIGIGVVEVYDLNALADSTLANISSRGFVDTGDNAMIGGFIVGCGSSGARVLVRGIGPSLSSFFPNALANPTLELRNADGSLIRENDDWRDSQETEIQETTIPPSNNLESAIIASVANGNYTAILRGKDNTTGVAVVEIYNIK